MRWWVAITNVERNEKYSHKNILTKQYFTNLHKKIVSNLTFDDRQTKNKIQTTPTETLQEYIE